MNSQIDDDASHPDRDLSSKVSRDRSFMPEVPLKADRAKWKCDVKDFVAVRHTENALPGYDAIQVEGDRRYTSHEV